MSNPIATDVASVYERWARTMTGVLEFQWWIFQTPFRAGMEMLKTVAETPPLLTQALVGNKSDDKRERGLHELERRAAEQTRRGLPPPREIYHAQNRDQIDWSQLPNWARALDPEVFAETPHEG